MEAYTIYTFGPGFLTTDDVTQPRIREVVDTLTTQNLLHKLPPDFDIVAERMYPEVPEKFYFVSQKWGQVINYASDCPCKIPPTYVTNVQTRNTVRVSPP